MLVAIVSQNSLVLVVMGYCTIVARYVAAWGIAQNHRCACVKLCTKGGWVLQHFGELLTSLKRYRAICGMTAIVSQYRKIWAIRELLFHDVCPQCAGLRGPCWDILPRFWLMFLGMGLQDLLRLHHRLSLALVPRASARPSFCRACIFMTF